MTDGLPSKVYATLGWYSLLVDKPSYHRLTRLIIVYRMRNYRPIINTEVAEFLYYRRYYMYIPFINYWDSVKVTVGESTLIVSGV